MARLYLALLAFLKKAEENVSKKSYEKLKLGSMIFK